MVCGCVIFTSPESAAVGSRGREDAVGNSSRQKAGRASSGKFVASTRFPLTKRFGSFPSFARGRLFPRVVPDVLDDGGELC